ncbi:MAG: TIM barrel protein [Anaerolinea sp.]|nr:TIM barrel protein [Anaerolinea sp.]
MRLGVIGLIPSDFFAVDDTLLQHIRSMGFSGVVAHIPGDPLQANREALRYLKSMLDRHQLRFVQLWGWYPSIVAEDPEARATGIAAASAIIQHGAEIGAEMIGLRPTSMSPQGPWSPHPANYHLATQTRLIDSLQQIAQACEQYQIRVALECHALTPLYNPAVTQYVLECVGSSWFGVNFDPVNFVADLATAYDSTPMINQLFDLLGQYALSAHVKDVVVQDDLVVHISEVPPGAGILDLDTFLRRFEALKPDAFAFIEHLAPEQIPAAAAFLHRKLTELNIPILE